jgi:hypothetical protein
VREAVRWFIGFDSVMELVSFLIAFAVAYQAFKGYRLTKDRTFLYLQFSFILLAAGLLADGLAGLLLLRGALTSRLAPLTELGYTILFLSQVVAYVTLIYAYLQKTRSLALESLALVTIPLLGYNITSELILVFLLFFISAQTAINFSVRKNSASFLVMLAFGMLTLSHLFFMLTPFDPRLFVFAHVAQLAGFVLLLVMLLQVNRSK